MRRPEALVDFDLSFAYPHIKPKPLWLQEVFSFIFTLTKALISLTFKAGRMAYLMRLAQAPSLRYRHPMPDTAILPAPTKSFRFTKENSSALGKLGYQVKLKRMQERAEKAAQLSLQANQLKTGQPEKTKTTVALAIEEKSERVRGLLSLEAEKQAERMAKASSNEVVEFKTMVDAADKLFGWSRSTGPDTLVQVGIVNQLTPGTPQVVVSTPEPTPQEPVVEA